MRPRPDSAPRHRRPRRQLDRRAAALLAGVVLLAAVGAVGTPLLTAGEAEPGPRPSDVAVVADASAGPGSSADAAPPARGPTVRVARMARGPVVRAAAVLRAWDERRARAWAEGDTDALRDLYVDEVGAADVRLLRRYADRGYRVEGMITQLLAVDVLERAPDRWRLRVTDRLARAFASRARERIQLPRDRANTHVVTLVRAEDELWRVAQVRLRGRLQASTGRSAQRRSE